MGIRKEELYSKTVKSKNRIGERQKQKQGGKRSAAAAAVVTIAAAAAPAVLLRLASAG